MIKIDSFYSGFINRKKSKLRGGCIELAVCKLNAVPSVCGTRVRARGDSGVCHIRCNAQKKEARDFASLFFKKLFCV